MPPAARPGPRRTSRSAAAPRSGRQTGQAGPREDEGARGRDVFGGERSCITRLTAAAWCRGSWRERQPPSRRWPSWRSPREPLAPTTRTGTVASRTARRATSTPTRGGRRPTSTASPVTRAIRRCEGTSCAGRATRPGRTWTGRAWTPAARPPATCVAAPPSPTPAHAGGSAACTGCHPVSATASDPSGSPHHVVPAPEPDAVAPAAARARGDRRDHRPAPLVGRDRALRRRERGLQRRLGRADRRPGARGGRVGARHRALAGGHGRRRRLRRPPHPGAGAHAARHAGRRPSGPARTHRRLAGAGGDGAPRRSPSSCSAVRPAPGSSRPRPRVRRTSPAPSGGTIARGDPASSGRVLPARRRRRSRLPGRVSASLHLDTPGLAHSIRAVEVFRILCTAQLRLGARREVV